MEIAHLVGSDSLLAILQQEGSLGLSAVGQGAALNSQAGLQQDEADVVLLSLGMLNATDNNSHLVSLNLCHRNVLFLGSIGNTSLKSLYSLGSTGEIAGETNQNSLAVTARKELCILTHTKNLHKKCEKKKYQNNNDIR